MHLKSIKLAGFKSFVDPTTVPIRSHMSAIVGPNGCGKSNIVDAIRWVIGETSAKQLRGQSMSDVIFNGTSNRKPVGRATVELHFDNSSGRVAGEYAQFTELVLRREVERDGQSSYFLNGSHCRRRDIIDIFLGTGLGSRSYSIIEQGMISQLVEAKPEDMRVHLEEVAGISKYKERRRETENRIKHTQENLDRLNDVREELLKQLRHLKRQANAAERYKVYKQEEREIAATIKVLTWQNLEQKRSAQQELIAATEIRSEEKTTELRAVEATIEKARVEREEFQEAQQVVQKHYYTLGEEIARLEQEIKHHQEQLHRWQKELTDLESLWEELGENSTEHQQQINELETELENLSPRKSRLQQGSTLLYKALAEAEGKMQLWQKEWDTTQTQKLNINSKVSVIATQIQHHKQELSQLTERQEKITLRLQQLPVHTIEETCAPLHEKVQALKTQQSETQAALQDQQTKLATLRDENKAAKTALEAQRRLLRDLETEAARLQAIQEAVLSGSDKASKEWLQKNNLGSHQRLGQKLQVVPGWETAVETVLSGYFDAVCVDDIQSYVDLLPQLSAGRVTLVEANQSQPQPSSSNKLRLVDQIKSEWSFAQWLESIFVVDNLEAALAMRHELQSTESVITRDGVWLGKTWLRISKVKDPQSGLLERERKLASLAEEVQQNKNKLQTLEQQQEKLEQEITTRDEAREKLQVDYQRHNSELSRAEVEFNQQKAKMDALLSEQQRLQQELQEAAERSARVEISLQHAGTEQHTLVTEQARIEQQSAHLQTERQEVESALLKKREETQHYKQETDEIEIRVSANESQLALLRQTVDRNNKQLTQLTNKREFLTKNLAQQDSPLLQRQQELQQRLTLRLQVEKELQACEERVTIVRNQLKEAENIKEITLKAIQTLQTESEQLKLAAHEIIVRQQTILEQLTAEKLSLDELKAQVPEGMDVVTAEQNLTSVQERIERLGPINLAAIEEHEAATVRKDYLDKQFADLNESLETLQTAIKKIDRETKTRFRETFDKVNEGFQHNFPRIFGGGRASLELLDDDLLATGIIVRAQPPGKRNTTIHMLSGGEKALTAIALIFAMFQLNPAPFCILDEVDAPLDDLNVNRFCQLVKEMSAETQFLIISHNKVTIGMADHLMGVTMQEPGVSRLVAVDMQEALELVEA